MSKPKIVLIFILLTLATLFLPKHGYASLCNSINIDPALADTTKQITISFSIPAPFRPQDYRLEIKNSSLKVTETRQGTTTTDGSGQEVVGPFTDSGDYRAEIFSKDPSESSFQTACSSPFTIVSSSGSNAAPEFTSYDPPQKFEDSQIKAYFHQLDSWDPSFFWIKIDDKPLQINLRYLSNDPSTYYWEANIGNLNKGTHRAQLYYWQANSIPAQTPILRYELPAISVSEGKKEAQNGGSQACVKTDDPNIPNRCVPAGGLTCQGGKGIETALGCLPTDPTTLIQTLLKFATGIGGGIALLLMIAGAFQMMTSGGNPEALKKGTAQMTSAVIGLLFIIFAVMLLQIIGVDILNLPGFGK